jgi:transposase-like protein
MMSQELPRPGDGWDEARRSAIVSEIAAGQLSVEGACRRYGLGADEIQEWLREFRRSALLAFDQRLQQTLLRQGADPVALAPAEFTGTLQDLSVADLVQSLQISGKSGVIVVIHEGQESRIWCSQGTLVDADSGRLGGEAALYRILSLEQGRVRAELRAVARQRTIHASTPSLLLEAAYRKDKSARLWRKLGDSESPLEPSGSPPNDTRDSMSSFLTSTGTRLSQRAAARPRLVPGWAWAAVGAALLLSFTLWLRLGAPSGELPVTAAAAPVLDAPLPVVVAETLAEVPAGAPIEVSAALSAAAIPAPPVASPVAIASTPAAVPPVVSAQFASAPPSFPRPASVQTRAVSQKLARRAPAPVLRKWAVAPSRRPQPPPIQKIDPELPHIQIIE